MELIDFILHVDRHLTEFVAANGPWIYALLFLIVFVETGFVVMPLLPGGSLRERIAGPMHPEEAIDCLASIAAALDHAHARGVLHRDVKPSNVLVDAGGQPHVLDFGIAKLLDDTDEGEMTRSGVRALSPAIGGGYAA